MFVFLISFSLNAQDYFGNQRRDWLQKAEESKPQLVEDIKQPITLVNLVKDTSAFQDWKAVPAAPMDSLYQSSFKKKAGVVVDFGQHLTGYYSFTVKAIKGTPDAPLRFRFTFEKCRLKWLLLLIPIQVLLAGPGYKMKK